MTSGHVRLDTLRPDADMAQANWTPSSGTRHFALMDEAPGFNTTDYVESDTFRHLDLWGYAELGATSVAIHAVQLVTAMQKKDAGTREARVSTVNGATRSLSRPAGSSTRIASRPIRTPAPPGPPPRSRPSRRA